MSMQNLYDDLKWRGIIKQETSPTLREALESPQVLYVGFDPTGDSLHVGSLLPLVTLRRFQLAGHSPIAVVGGATGMIGDPSGKTQERTLQDETSIARNLIGIRAAITRILSDQGANAVRIRNNADWLKDMSFLTFLREVGKHFTVNHMMAKESVRARLEDREHGISYTEFSYMLLQAWDFLVLHREENCSLQMGGSDQWGNITAGLELIRRVTGRNEGVHGLTHPLVTKSDGTKFGKTEQGTVWLDSAKTSPFRFYQFFIQTQDADVGTYLRYFTFLSHDEILALESSMKAEPEKRAAQLALAREVTRLVHGEEELQRAEAATQALFGESIRSLDERTLLDVLAEAPSTKRDRASIDTGSLTLIDLLVDTGLCTSKGNARKDIQGGGIYLNNVREQDPARTVKSQDLLYGKYLVLRKGKKTHHLLQVN